MRSNLGRSTLGVGCVLASVAALVALFVAINHAVVRSTASEPREPREPTVATEQQARAVVDHFNRSRVAREPELVWQLIDEWTWCVDFEPGMAYSGWCMKMGATGPSPNEVWFSGHTDDEIQNLIGWPEGYTNQGWPPTDLSEHRIGSADDYGDQYGYGDRDDYYDYVEPECVPSPVGCY